MQSGLTQSHFELFGLTASFEVDTSDLAHRYRSLQLQFHPDKYAAAADQEKRLAMQYTANINEAYQVLRDPLRRGRYLLELAGIELDDEADTRMDPSFLMEQMELREKFHAIQESGRLDAEYDQLADTLSLSRSEKLSRLARCFSSGNDEDLQQARELLRELQFLAKLGQDLENLEDELV